jgi:hypothetical protein
MEAPDDRLRVKCGIVGEVHQMRLDILVVIVQGVQMQGGSQLIIVKGSHVYDASPEGVNFLSGRAERNVKAVTDVHGLLDKDHLSVRALLFVDLSKLFEDVMCGETRADVSVIVFRYLFFRT